MVEKETLMKPYPLTYKKVRKAVLKALKAGTLQCQKKGNITNGPVDCKYIEGKYQCAIGCTLPKRVLAKIIDLGLNEGTAVSPLRKEKIIDANDDDMALLEGIQTAHDAGVAALKKFLKNNP